MARASEFVRKGFHRQALLNVIWKPVSTALEGTMLRLTWVLCDGPISSILCVLRAIHESIRRRGPEATENRPGGSTDCPSRA